MLDLVAHEVDRTGLLRPRRIDGDLGLHAEKRDPVVQRRRQDARANRTDQRVWALRIEGPKPVAAIARAPVEHEVADDDQLVRVVDVGPAPDWIAGRASGIAELDRSSRASIRRSSATGRAHSRRSEGVRGRSRSCRTSCRPTWCRYRAAAGDPFCAGSQDWGRTSTSRKCRGRRSG